MGRGCLQVASVCLGVNVPRETPGPVLCHFARMGSQVPQGFWFCCLLGLFAVLACRRCSHCACSGGPEPPGAAAPAPRPLIFLQQWPCLPWRRP